MDDNIKILSDQVCALECNLFLYIEELDNHMNECNCDKQEIHSFSNIREPGEIHIFCLNCGGVSEK